MLKFASFSALLILLVGANISCSEGGSMEVKGLNRNNMDTNVKPTTDFYEYANGGWLKNNPIPGEYSRWGSFEVLAEENYKVLRSILEKASENKDAKPGSNEQKIGDFYFTGMDTVKIENDGFDPIKPELKQIDDINSTKDLYDVISHFHTTGTSGIFRFYGNTDQKNSDMVIAQISQGGLGLPDRDYYTKDDSRSKDVRDKYVKHVVKMLTLIGQDETTAEKNANTIMNIETRLAKSSMTRVERRDPNKTYNKMSLNDLVKMAPGFEWKNFFSQIGLSDPGEINVGQPEFIKEVSVMMKDIPLDDWKTFLTWKLVDDAANFLSSPFVNENFNFNGKFLSGQEVLPERWKTVMRMTSRMLGEALGQIYVKEIFPPEAKQRANKIVMNLIDAMGERIKGLDWMSETTKEAALKKLAGFTVKIGYPDKWKDYSKLEIKRDSYSANVQRASEFSVQRNYDKIGKPVDKTEWGMTPQTVNAYYEPTRNEIVFPAAILQPPFFNQDADDAVNYGAMGAVIGHEVTHGFDDQGSQYDVDGNLKNWWTEEDKTKFKERVQKIIDQYDAFTPVDSTHVNGSLTTGENIADLGGLTVAFTAFKKTDEYKNNKMIDGFTPPQRFFLSWAQVWRNNIKDQALMLRLKTDPHSPGKYRVNGPFANMPKFWNAFNVKEGDPMRASQDKVVKIW
ncbi:MAG TPA: M13 family metallopeptidase [Ignavibacteriaceae bacterium]|nr:M13 family metallopeptidase [Ignavibacteriaceae bacterium]